MEPSSPSNIDVGRVKLRNAELFVAIGKGKLNKVKRLLESGVETDITDKNNNDNTPLHSAIENDKKEIIAELLNPKWKTNLNLKNAQGRTPMNIARQRNNQEIINLLKTHRVDESGDFKNDEAVLVESATSHNVTKNQTNNDSLIFQKTKGAAGIEGQLCEINLAIFLLLKGKIDTNLTEFYLASNFEKADKFDDIVFKYKNETGKSKTIFLQAKHKMGDQEKPIKRILLTNLLSGSESGDFTLNKYFISYRKIKQHFSINGNPNDPVFSGNFDECEFLIYTNAPFEHGNNSCIKEITMDDNDLFKTGDYQGKIFQLDFDSEKKTIFELLKNSSDCRRLAKALAGALSSKKGLDIQKDIFQIYHRALREKLIEKTDDLTGKLRGDFFSSADNQFKTVLFEEAAKVFKKSVDVIKQQLSKKELKLSSKFWDEDAKGFPDLPQDDPICESEIKDFLTKFKLYSSQPSEKKLESIIAKTSREFYKIQQQDIGLVFAGVENKVKNWWKDENNFLMKNNKFFEDALRVSVEFDVIEPVTFFTGRTQELVELHKMLQKGGAVSISQMATITGLGGIGKSETARKYLSEYKEHYDNNLIWINAETLLTITQSFQKLAKETLKIKTTDENNKEIDIKLLTKEVYNFFKKMNRKSIFVFDNAEKQRPGGYNVEELLPSGMKKPYVIITTRDQEWDGIEKLSLGLFTQEEAEAFIRNALNERITIEDQELERLAKELDCLPLALRQAVAYISVENGWSKTWSNEQFTISCYLNQFQKNATPLLSSAGMKNYPKPLMTTWKTSIDKIKLESERALQILQIIAYLAPDQIPVDEIFGTETGELKEIRRALEFLAQYSMISIKGGKVNIHRLVQKVTRIEVEEREQDERTLATTFALLKACYPYKSYKLEDYLKKRQVLPHLEIFSSHIEKLTKKTDEKDEKLMQTKKTKEQAKIKNKYLFDLRDWIADGNKGWDSVEFDVIEPDASFTGRTQTLRDLHRMLQEGGAVSLSQTATITGLGGIGKSEMVRKYLSLYKNDYDNNLIWINAETLLTITQSFQKLAKETFKIKTTDENNEEIDIKILTKEVYNFFTEVNKKCIFVFDNAEKQQPGEYNLHELLPSGLNKPHVLITSRHQDWDGIEKLSLGLFTQEEAEAFVRNAVKEIITIEDHDLQTLAKELDGLPLALRQAVAYISEENVRLAIWFNWHIFTISCYLDQLHKESNQLLSRGMIKNYTCTVMTTWKTSIQKIQLENERAFEILQVIAYLAPDLIPAEEIFTGTKSEQKEIKRAIELLEQYSMISVKGRKVNIHRLVQKVMRIEMGESGEIEKTIACTFTLLKAYYPYKSYKLEDFLKKRQVITHLEVFSSHIEKLIKNKKTKEKTKIKEDYLFELSEWLADVVKGCHSIEFDYVEPDALFTGRTQTLTDLHKLLQGKYHTTVTGLGGIGKSELARQYLSEYKNDYDNNAIWINAETHFTITRSFQKLAKYTLKIKTIDENNKEIDIKALTSEVYNFFTKVNAKSIFVFDNVENKRLGEYNLDELLPSGVNKPYVIITTRDQNWDGLQKLSLGLFTGKEADVFIKNALEKKIKITYHELQTLKKELGCLPLALRQAVAYISVENEKSMKRLYKPFTVSCYLDQLYKDPNLILSSGIIKNYTGTVMTTWKTSIQKMQLENERALEILQVMAYLAPDQIPVEEIYAEENGERKEIHRAIDSLEQYSMISMTDERKVSIHRLVQKVMRIGMEESGQNDQTIACTFALFKACYPYKSYKLEDFLKKRQLLPLLEVFSSHVENLIKPKKLIEQAEIKADYLYDLLEWIEDGHRKWHSIEFDVRDPNASFIGRSQTLRDLHGMLQEGGAATVSKIAAITGLGGIGKSETARKYLSHYKEHYDNNVVWINAENDLTLFRSFLTLAKGTLKINEIDKNNKEKDIKALTSEVYNFFIKMNAKSIFVFDNVENKRLGEYNLDELLPSGVNKPYVLITSRRQKWDRIEKLPLELFTQEESESFIKNKLEILNKKINIADHEIKSLINKLDRLPLALEQAVSYIMEQNATSTKWFHRHQFTISDYLYQFHDKADTLLNSGLLKFGIKNVMNTWKTTIEKIQLESERAFQILQVMAYLAPDQIPVEVIFPRKEGDQNEILRATELLEEYSLITIKGGKVNIHRLVQEVIRILLEEWEQDEPTIVLTFTLLQACYPYKSNKFDYYLKQQLLPHLEVFSSHIKNLIKPKNPKKLTIVDETNLFFELCEWLADGVEGSSVEFDYSEPDAFFTGRTQTLTDLHRMLQEFSKSSFRSHIATITGLGGIGKSELARQYLSQYKNDYDNNVIWINAETHFTITRSFQKLAKDTLKIKTTDKNNEEIDIKTLTTEVYNFFNGMKSKSIFVFDNAVNQSSCKFYLDKFMSGGLNKVYVIITSRHQNWDEIEKLPLGLFTQEEGEAFVRNALKEKITIEDLELQILTKELGCLPLALRQAVAYISAENERSMKLSNEQFTINCYLDKFQKNATALFSSAMLKNYTETLMTTWKTSIEKIQIESEVALEILQVMAYLAPDQIPVDEIFAEKNGEQKEIHRAIEILEQYSMISMTGKKVNIHKLVQKVMRIVMEESGQNEQTIACTFLYLKACYPYKRYKLEDFLKKRQVISHLEVFLSHIDKLMKTKKFNERNDFRFFHLHDWIVDGHKGWGMV